MSTSMSTSTDVSLDTLVSLCKQRGFVFPASEIYGGFGSTYDYGPLGVELKRNVKDLWWRSTVRERSDVVGLDSAIIQSPRVWEASGHVQNFHDPMVDCLECKGRFRADHLEGPTCPTCGAQDSFTEAREFNLMFRTQVGPVAEEGSLAYLRPETAQGIFINFENVLTSTRRRLPFGIAQQGKSFRNEITLGNFIFRTREFEQMEMEFFVAPDESNEWYQRWIDLREQWYTDLGINPETSAATSIRPRSSPITRPARPTCNTAIRGAGTSLRALPTAPTSTSRSTVSRRASASSTSTHRRTSTSCRT